MTRFIQCVFTVSIVVASGLFGQTADDLDRIQEQRNIDYGSAAYLAAVSGGLIDGDQGTDSAIEALTEAGFDGDSVDRDENARLDDFSFMLMLVHDLPGGIMYSLFPGPRYAYRELRSKNLFSGGGDPGEYFSGTRALRIVGRVMNLAEELDQ